jgi:predicted lactoylglutathione lyase
VTSSLVKKLGGTVLDPPGEFPYAVGGYYAVYFSGPDGMKFEFVYMPELEHHHRRLGVYGRNLWEPEA